MGRRLRQGEPKDEVLKIRCTRETKVRFKRIAAEFQSYEECLRKMMDVYEELSRAGYR